MSTRWFLCVLVAVFGLAAGVLAREPQPGGAQSPQVQSGSNRSEPGAIAEVALAELPAEARSTLATIRRGGPFDYDKDGTTFFNREGLLPRRPRGYYTEYTVRTPGARNRGARRIVAGGDPMRSGEYYYTRDHYRSFLRIRE
jgi:ribonuclease T1